MMKLGTQVGIGSGHFVCMIANDTQLDSRGGFSGSSNPVKT